MYTDMLNEIAEDKYGDDTGSSVSGSCDDTSSSVSGSCDDGSNRRLIFDWTDDDLDGEYFYNYDND